MTTAKLLSVVLLSTVAAAILLASTSPVHADPLKDRYPASEGTNAKDAWESALAEIDILRRYYDALQKPLPAIFELDDDGIAALLVDPFLAHRHTGGNTQQRYLVGRLVILNQSENEVSLDLDDVRLIADGEEFPVERDPAEMRYATAYLNGSTYSVSELKPAESLTIPPGHLASSWVVFPNLDSGNDAPDLELKWSLNDVAMSLDIREQHEAILGWSLERIGPRGIVAIGTIEGELNTVNLAALIDAALDLANQKVTRLIVQFGPNAEEVDSRISQWFHETSRQAGVEQTNGNNRQDLMTLPPMIRQFHFVNIPSKTSRAYAGRVHKHDELIDAVLSASATAYQAIEVEDLVDEIREGHPLSQCAALTHGAIRLPPTFLDQVLSLAVTSANADHEYAEQLRMAAIAALREFPEAEAVATLRKLATDTDEKYRRQAIQSLASSRFPAHQQALDQLLQGPDEQRLEVVDSLTKFPRQRWGDVLFTYATSGPLETRIASIRALNSIGHPKLMPLLIELLENEQPQKLRETALQILIALEDPDSRAQVVSHALETLKTNPNQQAISIVKQFKVQQAIPPLLELLRTNEALRSSALEALTAIGDNRILEDLFAVYPDLNGNDQATALRTIAKIDQRRFLDFAPQAFDTDRREVKSTLTDLLKRTPDLAAIQVLIDAAEQADDDDDQIVYIMQALGGIYSPQTREFLVKTRDHGSKNKQQHARNALESLYHRSPVNGFAQKAQQTAASGEFATAIRQFTLAIEGDPAYPPAYFGRGNAYRALNELEKSLQDYNLLLELDPKWPGGHASRGQTLSALARFEEALPDLNKAIASDPDNADWYSARGHVYSMLERFEPAETDYRKALALKPDHMTALTGVALSLAIRGKVDEAIGILDKGRSQFAEDPIFAYNSSCTYARAAEVLREKDETNDADQKRIETLIDNSLKELARSVELGYRDPRWALNDPDLAILRPEVRFQEILDTMRGGDKKKKKPSTSNDATEDAGTPPDDDTPPDA